MRNWGISFVPEKFSEHYVKRGHRVSLFMALPKKKEVYLFSCGI